MLILQRNVFSGCGIVLLVQAHTTVGMVAIIIMAAFTTIRIPVADTVEAILGLAETEIMEVYPTTNKAMLQVQVSSLTPKLLNTDYKTSMFRSIYSVNQAVNINKFDQKMGISF